MDVEEVLTDLIDRSENVIKKNQEVRERYGLTEENSDPSQREYLNYIIDLDAVKSELLGDFLRDLSHPDLSHLLAIYQCIKLIFDSDLTRFRLLPLRSGEKQPLKKFFFKILIYVVAI